jgi:integrase/recombinase XerC
MAQHFDPESRQNSPDNVFGNTPVGRNEGCLFVRFLDASDLADNSRRAMTNDVRKFAGWFTTANQEPFKVERVTTRDVTDFKDCLRREQGQAVSTVNRCLVTLRRYLGWLNEQGHVEANAAKPVKELRKQELAPKGLDRPVVRRLLREVELRNDIRANAIFHLFLYAGPRVSDLANLELTDLMLSDRSGSAVFRLAKGRKERSVPLPLPARRALSGYLQTRPPLASSHVFVGERGPLTEDGYRAICDKYSAVIGEKIHPHLLRHTFSHRYLDANPGDLVGLAQILGHENLNTTARYTKKSDDDLQDATDRMSY